MLYNRYYYQDTIDQETQCPRSATNTNTGMNTSNFVIQINYIADNILLCLMMIEIYDTKSRFNIITII